MKPKFFQKIVLITRKTAVFPGPFVELTFGRPLAIKTLIEIEKNQKECLLISQINSSTEDLAINNFAKVGFLAQIKIIKKTKSVIVVLVRAIKRVRIVSFIKNKEIFWANFNHAQTKKLTKIQREKLANKILKVLHLTKAEKTKNLILSDLNNEHIEKFIYAVLGSFPNDAENFKQKVIETDDLEERFKIINNNLNLMKEIKEVKKEDKDIDNSINKRLKSRLTRQQREYFLREKLRAIKEELNELNPTKTDIQKYLERLRNEIFPPAIKKRVMNEILRYESLPVSSAESGVAKNYIDWMMKIPWTKKTKEKDDLKLAQKILDQNHFGLKKAKRRIIEYLAAAVFSKKSSRGQIICLVGPPGVGKTSLGGSIAAALGRKYIRIALGGVKDESEIRGHRRTYIGSMPGKIIQAMQKVQTTNPLILIDEIDKMGSDFHGAPASAMLEVLDPEQNREFTDHYIEEPYDLSQVMFIATANYEGDIPPALYDRMEIIYLPSYTELEKLEITKKHLIPRILADLKLTKKQLDFTSEGVLEVIKHYTRESGVRQLNRLLLQVARRFIVRILVKKQQSEIITEKNVADYLEKRLYYHQNHNQKPEIGVTTGLAYTSFGGDILPIEATNFPGKGRLILTGKLGEILKESANIAFDYIKANHKFFGINFEKFEQNDFHIHLPEGAVPKDGPSAGTALTTALISLLTKQPVSHKIGMTGEITLRGKILPIGGLLEKSIAAARSRLETIFLPEENKKDLVDVPSEVQKKLKIIFVNNYIDLYQKVFNIKAKTTKNLKSKKTN